MLSTSGLFCERDDRVLFDNLEFSALPGRIVRIQGANGSGKTTLLRILCGLNNDYRGEIRWQDEPVSRDLSGFHQAVFYLGHAPGIKKILTPMENLRWFCATQGYGNDEDIRQALAAVGLKSYDDMPCYMMSAGQQRRVSLARLKLTTASLWILDEPFTALDHRGVAELEDFLAAHVREGGSIILTTHHPLQLSCDVVTVDLDERMRQRGGH